MTTNSLMASAISTSSFTIKRHSFTAISVPHYPKVQISKLIPFSSWNGLKQLTISKVQYSLQIGRSRKFKGKGVYASLFGVGAPEALVIGVVALLVFGPKGLAEVARNLGKTLREFQPTIRELQEVSNEFKSTLEREIGLDDIKGSRQDRDNSSTTSKTVSPSSITSSNDSRQEADPNGSPSPIIKSSGEDDMEKLLRIAEAEKQAERDLEILLQSRSDSRTVSQAADNSSSSGRAYSTEEYLKITEEQLKSAAQQQNEASTPEQSPFNAQSQSQDGPYSSEELSKITEQQQNETSSPQQSPSVGQSESQVSPAQAASAIPSSQKPESET